MASNYSYIFMADSPNRNLCLDVTVNTRWWDTNLWRENWAGYVFVTWWLGGRWCEVLVTWGRVDLDTTTRPNAIDDTGGAPWSNKPQRTDWRSHGRGRADTSTSHFTRVYPQTLSPSLFTSLGESASCGLLP